MKPTAAQIRKLKEYGLYDDDCDPFTREEAAEEIKEYEDDIKWEKERIKEDFESQVLTISNEFIDSDMAELDKPWKEHGLRKPSVALTKRAISYLNEHHPEWDEGSDKDITEDIFFKACRLVTPPPLPAKPKKKGMHGCLKAIVIVFCIFFGLGMIGALLDVLAQLFPN